MTGNEYQKLAMRTNDSQCVPRLRESIDRGAMSCYYKDIPEHDAAELICGVIGLCGESGEVADIVKKCVFHKHPLDIENIENELGDVLWYVALCCNAINVSMEDVMQLNIDKLKKRYPDGFSEERSINRGDNNE